MLSALGPIALDRREGTHANPTPIITGSSVNSLFFPTPRNPRPRPPSSTKVIKIVGMGDEARTTWWNGTVTSCKETLEMAMLRV